MLEKKRKNNIGKNFIRYDFKFDGNIVMNILFAISNYIFFTFITRMINIGNDSNGMQWIYLKGFNKRPLFLLCYFLFSVWKDTTKNLLFLKGNVCICKKKVTRKTEISRNCSNQKKNFYERFFGISLIEYTFII